jgi:hypothetical protein
MGDLGGVLNVLEGRNDSGYVAHVRHKGASPAGDDREAL